MDKIYKAMADANRRKILHLLREGEKNVSQIVEFFNIGQATISAHLAVLKKAGLLTCRVDKKNRIYSINWEQFEHFSNEINRFKCEEKVYGEIIMRRIY